MPESLAHSLEQYEARGRLPFYEEEAFEPASWLAILSGLGILPAAIDPVSARIDNDRAAGSMAQLAERLAEIPGRMPSYRDYLRRITG